MPLALNRPWIMTVLWLIGYVALWCIATVLEMNWLFWTPLMIHFALSLHSQILILSWLNPQHQEPITLFGLSTPNQILGLLQKRRQHQQRQRDKRKEMIRWFRNGAEALPDALLVFQRDQLVLWCNQPAAKLFNFNWPLDGHFNLNQLIASSLLLRYLENGDFKEPLELRAPESDEQFLEYRVIPYTEQLSILMVRDVTPLYTLEQSRKRFISDVSHELRTPLTVLKGYLEMGASMPEQLLPVQALGVMGEQTQRMESLVNQLLTLSRIESNTDIDENEIVDLPAMLRTLEAEAKALSAKRNHQIVFNIDPTLKARGNADQLRSAISNLVYNAVHYTPPHGVIQVRWFRHNRRARFIVQDSGEGITPKHISRLTERFYRVDKARSRQTGGSGLGLAIVKHALSNHHSHLKIESIVGQGSSFSFTLPARLVVDKSSTKEN